MPEPAEPAEHRDAVLLEWDAGDIDGRQQGSGRDRGGALDVVVEGSQAVAIALEQPGGVVAGEILPLQQHMRLRAMTADTKASTNSS